MEDDVDVRASLQGDLLSLHADEGDTQRRICGHLRDGEVAVQVSGRSLTGDADDCHGGADDRLPCGVLDGTGDGDRLGLGNSGEE